jgi:hypothetical protein
MTNAEEFRGKAEEFKAKAETAFNSTAKEAYLELARYRREMAEEAERQDK